MTKDLQSRKRQLVRDAIYDAAIDLFAQKGFDETTVEEIAEAAGISRRSFFRYFESKDDLLALNTVNCGEVLCKTVASVPQNLAPLEVVREAALAGAKFSESLPRTRQIIEIAVRSSSARQAHQSRMMEQQDKLAAEFSARVKSTSRHQMKPMLLAGMTHLINNAAAASWFSGEYKDIQTAARQCFQNLTKLFCDEPLRSSISAAAGPRGNASPAKTRKR